MENGDPRPRPLWADSVAFRNNTLLAKAAKLGARHNTVVRGTVRATKAAAISAANRGQMASKSRTNRNHPKLGIATRLASVNEEGPHMTTPADVSRLPHLNAPSGFGIPPCSAVAAALAELLAGRLASSGTRLTIPPEPRHLETYRALQDVAAGLVLAQVASTTAGAEQNLVILLTRLARRHINALPVIPAPATLAARCLQHLATHGVLAQGALGTDLQALENATSSQLDQWNRPNLRLADLDTQGTPQAPGQTLAVRLAATLAGELELIRSLMLVLVDLYDNGLRAALPLGPLSGTTATQHTTGSFGRSVSLHELHEHVRLAETAPSSLAAIRATLGPLAHGGARLGNLLGSRFGDYVTELGQTAELIKNAAEGLERCDRMSFAALMQVPSWRAENTLVVLALCKRLQHEGEQPDDIESFARALLQGALRHEIAVQSLLDSEIAAYGPRLAPQALTRALRYVRYEDPDCPTSVAHKQMISEAILLGDALTQRLETKEQG